LIVLKPKLISNTFVIKQTILFVSLLIIVLFSLLSVFVSVNLVVHKIHISPYIGYLISSFLIALVYDPIKFMFIKKIKTFFVKDNLRLRKELLDLSEELENMYTHVNVQEYIVKKLLNILLIKKAAFYQIHDVNPALFVCKVGTSSAHDRVFSTKDPFLYPLFKHGKVLNKKDVENGITVSLKGFQELNNFLMHEQYEVILPFNSNNLIWGFLFLGEKVGYETFSYDEIQLLASVAHNIAMVVENRKLPLSVRENSDVIKRIIDGLQEGVCFVDNQRKIILENSYLDSVFSDISSKKELYIQQLLVSANDMLANKVDLIAGIKLPYSHGEEEGFVLVFTKTKYSQKILFDKAALSTKLAIMLKTALSSVFAEKEVYIDTRNNNVEMEQIEKVKKQIKHFTEIQQGALKLYSTETINMSNLIKEYVNQLGSSYKQYLKIKILNSYQARKGEVIGDKVRILEVFKIIFDRYYAFAKQNQTKEDVSVFIIETDKRFVYIFNGPGDNKSKNEFESLSKTKHMLKQFKKGQDIGKISVDFAYIKEVLAAHKGEFLIENNDLNTNTLTVSFPLAYLNVFAPA